MLITARQTLRPAAKSSLCTGPSLLRAMRLRSSGAADVDTGLDAKAKQEVVADPPQRRTRRRIKTETDAGALATEPSPRTAGGIDAKVGVKREKAEDFDGSPVKSAKKKRTGGVKAKKGKDRVPRQEPSGWKEILRGIEEMRAAKNAEVDKYGCEVFFDESFPPHVCRFHVLIAAMMSSQTKDPVNAAAMGRLIKHGLTVESMLAIDQKELAQLIHPVGFFRNKAKYIKQTATILTEQAEGASVTDIPNTYEGLIALPGVGPKMATLVMGCAWKNNVGICVDTHVHRIANRLKWVKTWNKANPKSQDPEKTRMELEDWLPKEHWSPINPLLVGFGQTVCLPRGPKCSECKIRGICPSANSSAI